MKLVVLAAVLTICGADKLDRTYLPPASSRTAGGSPGAIQAPLGGPQGLPKGSFTNDFQGVVVDAAAAGTRSSESGGSGLGGPRNSYGSQDSKVGGAAFKTALSDGGNTEYVQGSADAYRTFPRFGFHGHDSSASNMNPIEEHHNQALAPELQVASLDRVANILRFESDVGPESFNYGFETENGITAEEIGVATNGVQAQGKFAYVGEDGKTYSVTYTADEGGYQPKGDHLPTPPPIPDAILRSLEKNARDEAAGIVDDGSYDAKKYNEDYSESSEDNGQFRHGTAGEQASTQGSRRLQPENINGHHTLNQNAFGNTNQQSDSGLEDGGKRTRYNSASLSGAVTSRAQAQFNNNHNNEYNRKAGNEVVSLMDNANQRRDQNNILTNHNALSIQNHHFTASHSRGQTNFPVENLNNYDGDKGDIGPSSSSQYLTSSQETSIPTSHNNFGKQGMFSTHTTAIINPNVFQNSLNNQPQLQLSNPKQNNFDTSSSSASSEAHFGSNIAGQTVQNARSSVSNNGDQQIRNQQPSFLSNIMEARSTFGYLPPSGAQNTIVKTTSSSISPDALNKYSVSETKNQEQTLHFSEQYDESTPNQNSPLRKTQFGSKLSTSEGFNNERLTTKTQPKSTPKLGSSNSQSFNSQYKPNPLPSRPQNTPSPSLAFSQSHKGQGPSKFEDMFVESKGDQVNFDFPSAHSTSDKDYDNTLSVNNHFANSNVNAHSQYNNDINGNNDAPSNTNTNVIQNSSSRDTNEKSDQNNAYFYNQPTESFKPQSNQRVNNAIFPVTTNQLTNFAQNRFSNQGQVSSNDLPSQTRFNAQSQQQLNNRLPQANVNRPSELNNESNLGQVHGTDSNKFSVTNQPNDNQSGTHQLGFLKHTAAIPMTFKSLNQQPLQFNQRQSYSQKPIHSQPITQGSSSQQSSQQFQREPQTTKEATSQNSNQGNDPSLHSSTDEYTEGTDFTQQYDGEVYEYNKPADMLVAGNNKDQDGSPTRVSSQNTANFNNSPDHGSKYRGPFNQFMHKTVAGRGEEFGGPRKPPSFDAQTGYHY